MQAYSSYLGLVLLSHEFGSVHCKVFYSEFVTVSCVQFEMKSDTVLIHIPHSSEKCTCLNKRTPDF